MEWPSIFHFNMNNSMKNISQYMSLWWFLFNLKFNTNETVALFLEFNNVFFYEWKNIYIKNDFFFFSFSHYYSNSITQIREKKKIYIYIYIFTFIVHVNFTLSIVHICINRACSNTYLHLGSKSNRLF